MTFSVYRCHLSLSRVLRVNMADNPSTSNRKFQNKPQKTQKRPFSKDHTFKKRPPHKEETGKNVIYVSTKTNTKVDRRNTSYLRLDISLSFIFTEPTNRM